MKSEFKIRRNWKFLPQMLLAATAGFALMSAHAFAEVVNASYANDAAVPIESNGFTATGKSLNLALGFAPAKGEDLMLVRNTGSKFIQGTFGNLAQGQIVALSYREVHYYFVGNYYGGHGRDLVLLSTTLDDVSAVAREKLDHPLLLTLKQARGQAPFDRPTTLRPENFARDGRVLVDLQAPASKDLANAIAQLGGQLIAGWQSEKGLRAWVPETQLEALASRADIRSISAARPSVTRRVGR